MSELPPSPYYAGRVTHEELREKLRMAGAYQFIDFICCGKVEQPELHIDKDKACPKMIPLRSIHGDYGNRQLKCPNCGVNKLTILSTLSQSSKAKEVIQVMVWDDSVRQGAKDGKYYTEEACRERNDSKAIDYLIS